jgi:hypothetical protein
VQILFTVREDRDPWEKGGFVVVKEAVRDALRAARRAPPSENERTGLSEGLDA